MIYIHFKPHHKSSFGNVKNLHSQQIESRDAIPSYQQYSQTLTDASENVHWLIVEAWVLLPCSKHQCTSQSSHDNKEVAKLTSIRMASAPLGSMCTNAILKFVYSYCMKTPSVKVANAWLEHIKGLVSKLVHCHIDKQE